MDSVSCNLHIDLPTSKEMGDRNEVSDCREVRGFTSNAWQRLACQGNAMATISISNCRGATNAKEAD